MKILRKTIRQVIMEAVRESELSNMCLMHAEVGVKNYYLLFGKPFLKDVIEAYQYENDEVLDKLGEPIAYYSANPVEAIRHNQTMQIVNSPNIYGMMIAAPYWNWDCRDAWEITLAAAQPGWGPTMYDIVMGDAPTGIMSDRESVSTHAKPLYDFYYNNRTDVRKYPLDNKERKYTSEEQDDCTWGSDGDYSDDRRLAAKGDEDLIKQIWYEDTLNHVYDRDAVNGRWDMEDNYFDAINILKHNGILRMTDIENFEWWRKVMKAFFNIQSRKRGS